MSRLISILTVVGAVAVTDCNYLDGSRQPACEVIGFVSGPLEFSNLCGDRFPLLPSQPESRLFILRQRGRYAISQELNIITIGELGSGRTRVMKIPGQVFDADISANGRTVIFLTYQSKTPVVTRVKLRSGLDENESDYLTCPIQERLSSNSLVSGPSVIALSDDGDRAVFGSGDGSMLIDFDSGSCDSSLVPLDFGSFLGDRNLLAGVDRTGNAFSWNATDGTVLRLGFVTMTPPMFDRAGKRAIISRRSGWLDPLYRIGVVTLGNKAQVSWQRNLTSAAAIGRYWFLSEGERAMKK